MPLEKEKLYNNLVAAFQVPKIGEPARILEDVASDLADAIDIFVRGGDVVGITTDITVQVSAKGTVLGQTEILTGTGKQTAPGKII